MFFFPLSKKKGPHEDLKIVKYLKRIFFPFWGRFLIEKADCAHMLCSTGFFLQMVSLLCIEKPSLDLHLVNFPL